jgi:Na+/proline symporter
MKAIVYSEVAQMIIKFMGIIIIIIAGLHYIGGWDNFLVHLDYDRLEVIDFSKTGFDGSEYGFFPMLFGGIFLYSSYYGTDQTQVQRLLSAKDELTVKKLLLFNGLFRFPITLAYCFGGLILGAFANSNSTFAGLIPAEKPDLMIPIFITNYLPHGIIGIIVVAIIAAGMSAYSSTLNSLSAVTMEDFISKKYDLTDKKYVLYSKLTGLGWGLLTMFFAFYVGDIAKTVIEAINKIGSMFYGPILAMFLLAILGKNVKATAANIGLVCGVVVNLILWLFFENVFWFWWNAIGAIVTLFLGVVISLFLPKEESKMDSKIHIGKFFVKENIILILFFMMILAFCYFLPDILVKP